MERKKGVKLGIMGTSRSGTYDFIVFKVILRLFRELVLKCPETLKHLSPERTILKFEICGLLAVHI